MTQTVLADSAQIGRAHLSQIENGAVAARVDTLEAICKVLGIKLAALFEGLD